MLQQSGLAALDFFETVSDNYGTDEAGFATDDDGTVDISRVEFELSTRHYSHLTTSIDPLDNSRNCAIDLFQQTLQYINSVT